VLTYEEALARILAAVPPPVTERVPLSQAFGRISTAPLSAALDLPPFDNSAMDGYALRAADVACAKPAQGVRLRLAGRVAAGENFAGELQAGMAVRLFTGSPVPRGADAVVMQEDTRSDNPGEVLVLEPVKPGENLRRKGEDIQQGSRLLDAGSALTAARLSLLAATGLAEVSVGRQPVVGLLATGSELREPGTPLGPGQIYESNRLGLAALTGSAGGLPLVLPLVQDDLPSTRQALLSAFDRCNLVLTSGGVSVGEMDFVRRAFTEAGGELQFWKVAIKPGRPFVFGRRGAKFLFGLPGNPVSAMVTFQLLVRPAVQRWQGAADVSLAAQAGLLAQPLSNPGERRHFVRVRLGLDGQVYAAGLQASHALSSLAAANGLLDMAPGQILARGARVRVLAWS
jgi:molybdopterin molybdotransferase